MYRDRIKIYKELEKQFSSKVLAYVTSDRQNMETQIGQDVIDYFINQLDRIGVTDKISLILYTRGGNTSAAWNIVNLLRMYCDNLQVIIPHKSHSAGTLISLGDNEIVITKQATLGPIDPSINTALNPSVPNGLGTFPVSVEAVKGYLEFAKNEMAIKDDKALSEIFIKLTDFVHPLVLGQVYRSRAQIQMLAEKLIVNQVKDADKIKKIISFLCSDSGSHDYTISRREAEKDLGLNIIKPNEEQYNLINKLYINISEELELNNPFNPQNINGEFVARRGILESIDGGADYFISQGVIEPVKTSDGRITIQSRMTFEGWKHDTEYLNSDIIDREEDNGVSKEVEYETSGEFQM